MDQDPLPDLDARVDEIFDGALDVPSGERSAFLDRACRDDAELRERVERLLAFSDNPPSLLEGSAASELWRPDEAPVTEPEQPTEVGPYRLLQEIGRGGMGVVYLGERADGHFQQRVAVKVLRPGSETPEMQQGFEQERQIIASLTHANIARLYDGGISECCRPYSAMELVEGQPITRYCDDHQLTVDERLRLVEEVTSAVLYAHQNLVVHCDLKPSNILVTDAGEIKLLDFGIAKMLDASGADPRPRTPSGSHAITPLYASPEQLRGEPVTTASDIYQLGLLLFELLTGERGREIPSGSRPVDETAAPHTLRTPSTVVQGLDEARAQAFAAARATSARSLVRTLRGDLDRIVQAAMAWRLEARYRSAAELMADLERYRNGEPLAVGPNSLGYRASRFMRRNRWAVTTASLLIALLIAYSVTVTVQARQIARERDRAQRIQSFALGVFGASDPRRALGPEVSAAELVARGVDRAEAELAEEPDVKAEVYAYLGGVYRRLGLFHEAEPLMREVLALRRQAHDGDHPEIAAAQHSLGHLLLERDDPEALELLEDALRQRRELLGNDQIETAYTLSSLGAYLRSAGRLAEAEQRYHEAIAILRVQDPDGEGLADAFSGLAWVVRLLGRPEEAEPMLRQALKLFKQHYGEIHPQIAAAWNNLANGLWQLEHWDEGDEAMHKSIEIKQELYGEIHPNIAISLGNLAGSLSRRGELDEAARLYRQAYEMRQEIFGPSHPRVAQSQAQIAEVLHRSGQLQEAEAYFQESLTIFRQHLPEDHPSFARVWRGIGAVWIDAGELDRAREALKASRDIYAQREGSPWPWRVEVLLAAIDRRQGRSEDAAGRLDAAMSKLGDDPKWLERWQQERDALDAGVTVQLPSEP
ncbi:MAG: serine/threonine-protein kinase [Acidobacteriota bacterium]